MAASEDHDVVVVGAGVAGVSCALECFDIRLDTVLLEQDARPGGQLAEIPHAVRNIATSRHSTGSELRESLENTANILGPRLRLSQRVVRVNVEQRWVETDEMRLRGRALVVATGTRHQYLPAAVDGSYGGDVTYLLEARPGHFAGRAVAVIGGGDSAALDALELAESGSDVKLVHRSEHLTARHDIVEAVRHQRAIEEFAGWELDAVSGGDRLEAVVIRTHDGTTRRLAVGGLVVKIARLPRTELFQGQLDLDHAGAIVVDRELRTSCDGVFAAGDVVVGAYARVATALGQGSLAARSVLRHLQHTS
jgi:thioredoxin reductase (NADPH)